MMARQTKKYVAAATTMRVTVGQRVPHNLSAENLYERLEAAGYWWNQEKWTNAPRPTGRSKRISIDGAGANPDLIEFRVTAQSDKVASVVEALRGMAQTAGWAFVQQSEGYENRDQVDAELKRVRVYASFIAP